MTDTIAAPDSTTAGRTSSWMRLARMSAIAVAVWAVVLQVTAATFIPPVTAVGLVFLGFAPFLSGERRRLGLVYAVVAVVAVAGNLPTIAAELARPESAPGFILTLFSMVAAGVALVAGLAAFFRRPVPAIRRVAYGAVGVLVIGTIASLVVASGVESQGALESDVTVTARGVLFEPEQIVLGSGSTGVWVDNRDGVHHTFTIPGLGVDLQIPALKAQRVDIQGAIPGEYQVICTVPGHENMTATLTVTG